jgi:hypothetical protein
MAEKKFKEITGMPLIDIQEEGQSFEGQLLRTQAGEYGDNFVLAVNGEEKLMFTSTVLQQKMNMVKIGQTIRVTNLGDKKSTKNKGKTYRDFKVEVAE